MHPAAAVHIGQRFADLLDDAARVARQKILLPGLDAFLDVARNKQLHDDISCFFVLDKTQAANQVGMIELLGNLPFMAQGLPQALIEGVGIRQYLHRHVFITHLVKDFPDARVLAVVDPVNQVVLIDLFVASYAPGCQAPVAGPSLSHAAHDQVGRESEKAHRHEHCSKGSGVVSHRPSL